MLFNFLSKINRGLFSVTMNTDNQDVLTYLKALKQLEWIATEMEKCLRMKDIDGKVLKNERYRWKNA